MIHPLNIDLLDVVLFLRLASSGSTTPAIPISVRVELICTVRWPVKSWIFCDINPVTVIETEKRKEKNLLQTML
jgi:hypothetical protein